MDRNDRKSRHVYKTCHQQSSNHLVLLVGYLEYFKIRETKARQRFIEPMRYQIRKAVQRNTRAISLYSFLQCGAVYLDFMVIN